ncbi:MAG: hypothetical protein Q9195_007639 [Heterodermia aff. obscurata]
MAFDWIASAHSSLVGAAILTLGVIYTGSLIVNRLFLSPIACFPGPKLAAVTFWYEFYFDVFHRGRYVVQIAKLHARYGPIIRINPFELHVGDSAFYVTLYANGPRREKWPWYTEQFGMPGSIFSAIDHDLHRARRAPLNQFFSAAMVRKLQPMIEDKATHLLLRFGNSADQEGTDTAIVRLDHAFAAFANDVVMEYSLGRSENRLSEPDFGRAYHDVVFEFSKAGHLLKQMHWILRLVQSLPTWLALKVPGLGSVIKTQLDIEQQITLLKSSDPSPDTKPAAQATIFPSILHSSLPPSEKSNLRLRDEAFIMLGAGTLTTSWALTVATFYLLSLPPVLTRLKTELRTAIPDPDSSSTPLSTLEQLPYLTAIINESLRLSYGTTSRLQRVCPDQTLLFTDNTSLKQYSIPPNTPVSMTSLLIHHNESLFPNSHSFSPERWLTDSDLKKSLVSFSKGSRQCIGINLAHAELYCCVARLFRIFGSKEVRFENDEGYLELWETDVDDVRTVADGFVPLVKEGSKGVRIKVKR